MKRLLLILACLFSSLGWSQIASAEYFIDTDLGVGSGTALTVSGNVIDQNFSIPTAGLSDGVHKLYVRMINDDGSWSLYAKNVFYVNPNNSNSTDIVAVEYFIDTDLGVGSGTALTVSGNVINQNFNIPTNGLSDGVHKLYVRAINDDDTWSLYAKNVFYVNPNNSNSTDIVAAEYFIDTDLGVGSGTALTVSGNVIDQNFNIPTAGLSDGVHKLYVRMINDDGSWSLYAKNVFYVNPNNSNSALITSAEYFFDIDPGIGNGTSIDLNDGVNFDEDIIVQVPVDLTEGDHFLYLRVLNTDGKWSLYVPSEMLTTLSLPDFSLKTFKFYPNPVKDILYFDTNDQVVTDFKIIDLNGRIIMDSLPVGNQMNLGYLSSGTYLFQLKTEMGSISKKIIKD